MIFHLKRSVQRHMADAGKSKGANVSTIPESTEQTLRRAAKTVERAAFDAAGEQSPSMVSQLIMIAAELERLAQVAARQNRGD